jgi:hypothetical protein
MQHHTADEHAWSYPGVNMAVNIPFSWRAKQALRVGILSVCTNRKHRQHERRISFVYFFYIVYLTLAYGPKCANNPWSDQQDATAGGIEWIIASPPAYHTFGDQLPVMYLEHTRLMHNQQTLHLTGTLCKPSNSCIQRFVSSSRALAHSRHPVADTASAAVLTVAAEGAARSSTFMKTALHA